MKNAAGTGPGTINVTGEYADLDFFDNTQTFNNATINLGNTIGYTDTLYAYDTAGAGGQVLTLASGVTVDVVGYAAITSSSSSGDGIVNKGVINDTTSPNVGSLTIEGNAFTNQGSINVENGQNLTVDSTTFANTGTITVDGTSAVTFESALTTAQLGTVHAASGATLDFAGTLNNIKATFHVGAGVLARRRDRRRHDQRRGQPDGERPELGLPRGSDGEKRRRNRPGHDQRHG